MYVSVDIADLSILIKAVEFPCFFFFIVLVLFSNKLKSLRKKEYSLVTNGKAIVKSWNRFRSLLK